MAGEGGSPPGSAEQVVARAAMLLSGREDFESAALLAQVDAAVYEFIDGWVTDSTNWSSQARALVLDVPDALLPDFTRLVLERISAVALDLTQRAHEDAVVEVRVRPTLAPVVPDWRQAVGTTSRSNQAPTERRLGGPEQDGLVFANAWELAIYRALVRLQHQSVEENTFAIAPLPGVRLRADITWHPDFLVVGGGRAMIIECDGPHHRTRLAADHTRDLQYLRCNVPTVRILVETTEDEHQLEGLLREHLRRNLWSR